MSIHPLTDKMDLIRLLQACHQRQPAAQQQLYQEYYAFARHVALNYSDDNPGAEDIVQDAFIKLFGHLEAEVFSGDFNKFFRRVIINTGIDHYRARSTRRRLSDMFVRREQVHTENMAPKEWN